MLNDKASDDMEFLVTPKYACLLRTNYCRVISSQNSREKKSYSLARGILHKCRSNKWGLTEKLRNLK